jgi:hypothetical protein
MPAIASFLTSSCVNSFIDYFLCHAKKKPRFLVVAGFWYSVCRLVLCDQTHPARQAENKYKYQKYGNVSSEQPGGQGGAGTYCRLTVDQVHARFIAYSADNVNAFFEKSIKISKNPVTGGRKHACRRRFN